MKEGWDAWLTPQEVKAICDIFEVKYTAKGNVRLQVLLPIISKKLYDRYKDTAYYRVFTATPGKPPSLRNLNKEQMEYILSVWITNKRRRTEKLTETITNLRVPLSTSNLSTITHIPKERMFDIMIMLEGRGIVQHTGSYQDEENVNWKLTPIYENKTTEDIKKRITDVFVETSNKSR